MTEAAVVTFTAERPADRVPPPTAVPWPWIVAGVAFVAIVGAAGFRAVPGVLIHPLHEEFGWSVGVISAAVSLNLMLFGLTAPFAAALMDRFGMRRVVASALLVVAAGSGLSVFVTSSWQLLLCWGVLIGFGTGSMALAFVATVTGRWFVRHRGLVTGVLTAGSATGQLIFLPVTAAVAENQGWRTATLIVSGAALLVVPLVLLLLRERPVDVGQVPYGAAPGAAGAAGSDAVPAGSDAVPIGVDAGPDAPLRASPTAAPLVPAVGSPLAVPVGSSVAPSQPAVARSLAVLRRAAYTRGFWLLVAGFAICGATTVGLVGTHFIPAAHDHGMPATTAAGLLAAVGVLDIIGTVFSGWLTDRVDSRILLAVYYALRGASLLVLPSLFGPSTAPSMLVFIVFYGLDWVATVPPTVALCRQLFGEDAPVVFGWVFASHQVGAAFAVVGAGLVRDRLGDYAPAWYVAGGLAVIAAVLSLRIPRAPARTATPQPVG